MQKLRGLVFASVILLCAGGAHAFEFTQPQQLHAPQIINPQSPSLEHLLGPGSGKLKPLNDANPKLDRQSGLPTGKRSHKPITIE
jgi:hypothetical protein